MGTPAENKAIVREFFDRLNDQDLTVVDEVCADEFVVDISLKGTDDAVIGTEGMEAMYEEYYAAFDGFHHEIDEVVAEGDLVAVFLTTTGTHTGEFRGVQPTGNEIEIEDNGLVRIQDGEIMSVRPLADMLGLFEQLDVSLDL